MDWKLLGAGVAFFGMGYFSYWSLQRRKRNRDKNDTDGVLSVLDIETWGCVIIGFMLGTVFIIESFF